MLERKKQQMRWSEQEKEENKVANVGGRDKMRDAGE